MTSGRHILSVTDQYRTPLNVEIAPIRATSSSAVPVKWKLPASARMSLECDDEAHPKQSGGFHSDRLRSSGRHTLTTGGAVGSGYAGANSTPHGGCGPPVVARAGLLSNKSATRSGFDVRVLLSALYDIPKNGPAGKVSRGDTASLRRPYVFPRHTSSTAVATYVPVVMRRGRALSARAPRRAPKSVVPAWEGWIRGPPSPRNASTRWRTPGL